MIAAGDIVPRRDSNGPYVAVLSNSIHLAANTGRVITCPFIPGRISDEFLAMVVAVDQPEGTLLSELVQWLPTSALGESIGRVGPGALGATRSIVAALICG